MRNRFKTRCHKCGVAVLPGAGEVRKQGRRWVGACADHGFQALVRRVYPARRSIEIRTSGGTFYRNAAGRCEDAPCCGCCTT